MAVMSCLGWDEDLRERWGNLLKNGRVVLGLRKCNGGFCGAVMVGDIEGCERLTLFNDKGEFMRDAGDRCWGWSLVPIPKNVFRPFTAKEWGARIGDEFIYGAGNRVRLATVGEHYIDLDYVPHQFNPSGGRIRLRESDYEAVKQLDGSPCGVFEEVKG